VVCQNEISRIAHAGKSSGVATNKPQRGKAARSSRRKNR
jgi:hypothetical protein